MLLVVLVHSCCNVHFKVPLHLNVSRKVSSMNMKPPNPAQKKVANIPTHPPCNDSDSPRSSPSATPLSFSSCIKVSKLHPHPEHNHAPPTTNGNPNFHPLPRHNRRYTLLRSYRRHSRTNTNPPHPLHLNPTTTNAFLPPPLRNRSRHRQYSSPLRRRKRSLMSVLSLLLLPTTSPPLY